MLKNAIDRVKLLKTGFVQKQIEKLYIEENNFEMLKTPIVAELIEINENRNERIDHENPVYASRMVCSDMKDLTEMLRFEELALKQLHSQKSNRSF